MTQVFTGWTESPTPNFYNTGGVDGGDISVSYRTLENTLSAQETLDIASISLSLTDGYNETIVSGSVRFEFGGRTYVDRQGQLYYDIDPETGAGTFAGTIDYATGNCILDNWAPNTSNVITLLSLSTTLNFTPIESAVFRIPVAPVKTGSFSIRCVPADGGGQISATSAADGTILTADMDGFIDYETGVVNIRFGIWVTAAGNEGEWWFDPNEVVGLNIFKPRHVYSDTLFYNAVSFSYLPLSADILGLNPVRLPADGRVPVYAPGDVVVVLHDQKTTGTYTSSGTTNLSRSRIAKLSVRDSADNLIDTAAYTADLDNGVITWGDLVGISQPLTIADRIEDMAVVSDVQISGELSLSQPLTHDFPVHETLISNAVIYGDLFAHTTIPFDQQTWTNEWSDDVIGTDTVAQYSYSQYPFVLTNASTINERWVIIFNSATTYTVTGEHVGQIATGSTGGDTAPINPNTGDPYFTIPFEGWGAGWSAGNVLRFNTLAANVPLWVIQAISQGEMTSEDFTFCLEFRGDIDTVI